MEMLIFLNGILIAVNAHLLIKSARKEKKPAVPAEEARTEENTIANQFANMMAYNGTAQGGGDNEN